MKYCYKGTWIDPSPQWFWEGNKQKWDGRFLAAEEGSGELVWKEHVLSGTFISEDTAIAAIKEFAKRVIDGGIEQSFGPEV